MKAGQGEKKKMYMLAAALAVLALIWGYRFVADYYANKSGPVEARKDRSGQVLAGVRPFKVDLDLLEKEPPPLMAERNIFGAVYTPPKVAPPPPPPPPPPKPTAPLTAEQMPEWKTAEKRAADAALQEMKGFKFLGFLKRKDRTDVFLSLGNEYFVAAAGEPITKQYFIKDIGTDYILFADRATETEYRLKADFSGKESGGPTLPLPGVTGGGSGGSSRPAPAKPAGGGRSRPSRPPTPSRPPQEEPFPEIPGDETPTPPPVMDPAPPPVRGTATPLENRSI